MTVKDESSNQENIDMSIRIVVKIASAVVAGLALIVPEVDAFAGAMGSQIDYGQRNGQVHLDETNIYPLLAAWLVLTTTGNNTPATKHTLMSVANISDGSAQALMDKFTSDLYRDHFKGVRDAFVELAKGFATAAPYSGGHCPDSPATLKAIASSPCPKASPK